MENQFVVMQASVQKPEPVIHLVSLFFVTKQHLILKKDIFEKIKNTNQEGKEKNQCQIFALWTME